MHKNMTYIQKWADRRALKEAAIRRVMNTEGLQPHRRFGAPGDRCHTHILPHHQVIYVLKGSITIGLPERDQQVTLRAGDRLDLLAGVAYHAIIGSKGLICLEAHCHRQAKT